MRNLCFVLGLGESLKEAPLSKDIPTIGVNDIWKYWPADYVVICNHPSDFTEDRKTVIKNCKPSKLYSCYDSWLYHPSFEKWKVAKGKDISEEPIPVSRSSVFPACVIAYKLGFSEIVLWGSDMKTHPRMSSKFNVERSKKDFKRLAGQLKEKGVSLYVGSEYSALSEVLEVWGSRCG